jgi:Mg-chelatase subunit ChlD
MSGTKIADLKEAVSIFLSALGETAQDESVGLASYSTAATRDHDLTQDLADIDAEMQQMTANGYTNIGGGIDVGRAILNDGRSTNFVEKTMILMTDGLHNTGTDPIAAAGRAELDGIVVHTITFGADADSVRMTDVARITGGTYNHAPDGEELKRIYREIALTLATQLSD